MNCFVLRLFEYSRFQYITVTPYYVPSAIFHQRKSIEYKNNVFCNIFIEYRFLLFVNKYFYLACCIKTKFVIIKFPNVVKHCVLYE